MKSSRKLKNITLKIGSGSTPRGGKSSYLENSPYKLIRSQNVYNHHYTSEGLAYITEEQAEKLKSVSLKEDDILINITGDSVARTTIVQCEMLPARVNQHVSIIRCKENLLDPYYLLAFLTSKDTQNYLLSLAQTGGTRAALTKGMLEQLEIPLASYEVQKNIGNILKMLNEKINVNNSIISSLENLSQSLFKHWFIDFEFPNEQGKPYKSSGGKMGESELGELPEGWIIKPLDEVANYQNGLAMQKYRPEENISLPVLKIKELNQGFTDFNSDRCSINIKDSVKVFNGDVIFSWSGTLLVKLWAGGNAGLNQHLFKVTSTEYSKWFYYLWTNYYLRVFQARAAEKATTMGHIKRSHLKEAKVFIPTISQLERTNKVFTPIIERIITLGIENKKLEQLRDTLLPKLLSGEIKIPDEVVVD